MKTPHRYTKRPVTIEAIQWTSDDAPRVLIDFTNHLVRINEAGEEFYVFDRLHNEWIPFQYGDWIIKGLQGEHYPVKDDVFRDSYRPEPDFAPTFPSEEQVDVDPLKPRTFTQQVQAIRHDGSTRTGSAIIDWAEQHGESNLYFRCDEGEGCRSESHELRVANPGGAEYLCPPGWWVVLDNDECVYFLDPDYMDNNWTEEEG